MGERSVSRAHRAADCLRQLQWELCLLWAPETPLRNALPGTGDEKLIWDLNCLKDFLTYSFCLGWWRFNSSLMPTPFPLWVVVNLQFVDTQKWFGCFLKLLKWKKHYGYICVYTFVSLKACDFIEYYGMNSRKDQNHWFKGNLFWRWYLCNRWGKLLESPFCDASNENMRSPNLDFIVR